MAPFSALIGLQSGLEEPLQVARRGASKTATSTEIGLRRLEAAKPIGC
jgi:hypothetical protein